MSKPEFKLMAAVNKAASCIVFPLDRAGDGLLYAIDNFDQIVDFLLKKLWGLSAMVDAVAYPIEYVLDKTGDAILLVLRALVKTFGWKSGYTALLFHFIRSINS